LAKETTTATAATMEPSLDGDVVDGDVVDGDGVDGDGVDRDVVYRRDLGERRCLPRFSLLALTFLRFVCSYLHVYIR
jgi:hypothetical protein